tara:strand:- start:2349 stop:3326 length:978 start_codon:yes stop_codon:yes gene_type:complete
MNNTIKFLVSKINVERLDVYLSKKMKNYTRSFIKKLILQKLVSVNRKISTSPSLKIKKNDRIIVKIVKKREKELIPKKIKLNIIYEDSDILVINKPKGLVVHPGAGNFQNTLANGLIFRYKKNLSNINGDFRPGIVHRIDKETSGLLVIAKNNLSHSILSEQFSNHTIKRKYDCLVWGVIRPLNGRIETLIARNKNNRQLMTVSEINGKRAVTNYKTLKVFASKDTPKISLVECELETGRTHQIRVHFKYKGTSLVGDEQYGKKNIKFKKINKQFLENLKSIKGQALHAKTLEFIHPTQKKWMSFGSNHPLDFEKMLSFLNNLSG